MKLKTIPKAPDLKADTVAVLLGGWGAHPPTGIDPGPHGFAGGFLALAQPDGPATLWRAHEAFLRAMAKSWHWTPEHVGPDGQTRYFGEHCAAGFPPFMADVDDADDDDTPA